MCNRHARITKGQAVGTCVCGCEAWVSNHVFFSDISYLTMAVLSMDCCDHMEDEDVERNVFDDSMPRFENSLRTRGAKTGSKAKKPDWKASVKENSPSVRTYSEGGSLRTQRIRYEE